MSARRRVNGSRPSGGGVPWGGDTASDLIVPLDTDYDALTQELQMNLLSLPGDNNEDNKKGREKGAGPILRVSHDPSRFASRSTMVLTLVNRPLLLLLGRGGDNDKGGGRGDRDGEGMAKLNGEEKGGRGKRRGGEGGGPPREPGKVVSDFLTHEDIRDRMIDKEDGVAGGGEGGGASLRAMKKERRRHKKMSPDPWPVGSRPGRVWGRRQGIAPLESILVKYLLNAVGATF